MSSKLIIAGLAVLGVAFAAPVSASQKGVNACTKVISDNGVKTTKAVAAVYTKCAKAVEGCLAKAIAAQPACLTGLNAAGKACGNDTLDLGSAISKAGKPLSKALIGIGKKCDPAIVADATKITLGTGATNGSSTGTLLDTNTADLGANVGGTLFVGGTTYATFETAVRDLIIRNIVAVVQDKHPRVWWLLRLAGVSLTNLNNLGLGLGTHHVSAAVDATLNTYSGGVPLLGIVGEYDVSIGPVNPATGIADVTIPSATTSFSSVFIPIAGGITVCVDAPTDGSGQLCCSPACGSMGPISYDVNQDRESSGNNAAFGLLPGGVGPADPTCTSSVTNLIGGGSNVVSACLEGPARSGGCNADGVGANNPQSGAPRCLGGTRNGRFCDPAIAADCPGAAGCPGGGGCCSQSPAVGPLLAPPCNGPATVVNTAGSGTDGDMVLGTSIQFTLHSHTLDGITYAGGGCANIAGDAKPDGWGCDGIACTDDDTTTPGDPANLAQTIGTTSANVLNANLIPTGFGGVVPTQILTGAKPANACHRLSASVTTGYTMVAAFPALTNAQLGDTATEVVQAW